MHTQFPAPKSKILLDQWKTWHLQHLNKISVSEQQKNKMFQTLQGIVNRE